MIKIELICKKDIPDRTTLGIIFIKDKTYKAILSRDGSVYRFGDFERGIIDRKCISINFRKETINKYFRRKYIKFGR